MIVFDLECRAAGHRFEGWFGSSQDFAGQQARGLVCCPECGSADVAKAPMAPNVGRKGNQSPAPATAAAVPSQHAMAAGKLPPQALAMLQAVAAMQAEALKTSRWVGDGFAEESRAIHYGEREVEPIHGEATIEEVQALHEEGIEIMPLLVPVAPPGEVN